MEKVIIEGVVEHGRRLGRELGFPTANVAVPDSVAAEDGVYRSRAEVDGAVYDAMSNLGRNPSVVSKRIFSASAGRCTAVCCAWNCSKRSATSGGSIRWRSCGRRSKKTRNIF